MSISYLVTAIGEIEDSLELAGLESKLRERWDNLNVTYQSDSETSPMYWEIDFGEVILEGRINSNRNVISLEGYIDDVAEFVVWYRSIMPPTQQLSMFDSGYNVGEIEITQRITRQDIISRFS